MSKELGAQIKYYRNQKRMTQEELAQKVGLATITIRQYESGAREPNASIVEQIADALGINWALLYPVEQRADAIKFNVFQSFRTKDKTDIPAYQPQYADYKTGAKELHTPAWEKARRAFYKLPNDWQKDTAINWQIEILHKKMGKNYNNAVFEALLRLYQSDDSFSQELAERLESLLYGQPTDPDKK